MRELLYGFDVWEKRSQVFDWCESRFGLYVMGDGARWKFYYTGEWGSSNYVRVNLEEEDAIAFILAWGKPLDYVL